MTLFFFFSWFFFRVCVRFRKKFGLRQFGTALYWELTLLSGNLHSSNTECIHLHVHRIFILMKFYHACYSFPPHLSWSILILIFILTWQTPPSHGTWYVALSRALTLVSSPQSACCLGWNDCLFVAFARPSNNADPQVVTSSVEHS